MSALNFSGMKFGRLTALRMVHVGERRRMAYECVCECGNKRTVLKENLTSGRQKSCGCLNRELSPPRLLGFAVKHGMHKTRTYSIWSQMKRRCQTQSNGAYQRYGARGVHVCDRWQKFENFLTDMGECPAGLTLERIDNERGYEPGNCKWATWKEQANNRSNNVNRPEHYQQDQARGGHELSADRRTEDRQKHAGG